MNPKKPLQKMCLAFVLLLPVLELCIRRCSFGTDATHLRFYW